MGFAALAAIAACAPGGPRSFARNAGTSPAADVPHLEVPFFSDRSDQCGPSTLASVFNYWGLAVSPAELKTDIYVRSLHGTLPLDMMGEVRERGFVGRVSSGSTETVRAELRAGRPVIAYLDFGMRSRPIGHYVVITGFDASHGWLYVHSGPRRDKRVTTTRFFRGWNATDRWMMVVTPPSPKNPPSAAAPPRP